MSTPGISADELSRTLSDLLEAEPVPETERLELEGVVKGADAIALPAELCTESGEIKRSAPGISAFIKEADPEHDDIRNQIAKMRLPQKVKLALFGNSTCRMLLIRDPNRMVSHFVLKNPRIQLQEIEEFSRNPNLSEQVLRTIAGSQAWMKSYSVKASLVTNPKTPPDLSLKWIRFLNMTDLRKIAKSKNVPQVVSVAAKKKVEEANLDRK